MPDVVPFVPSDNNYVLGVTFADARIYFSTRWNERDEAWYLDLYDDASNVIATGIKVVLGVNLGGNTNHPWFKTNSLVATDTSGNSQEAGFDDLGARVIVMHSTLTDIVAGTASS